MAAKGELLRKRKRFSLNRFDITITVALKSGLKYEGCMIWVLLTETSTGAVISCVTRLMSALPDPLKTMIQVVAANFTGSLSELSMTGLMFSSIQKSCSRIEERSSGKLRL